MKGLSFVQQLGEVMITTDASKVMYEGRHMNMFVQGYWSEEQASLQTNLLEMKTFIPKTHLSVTFRVGLCY